MDGLVTTFAIVTGAVGASLSPGIILIIGLANVLADAFSMGSSSYLSAVSEESIHEHRHSKKPLRIAVATFVSFSIIGLVPLSPFLIAFFVPSLGPYATYVSIAATLIAFAGVGYISGVMLGKNPLLTAMRNVVIGGVAATIAFVVGYVLASVFGV